MVFNVDSVTTLLETTFLFSVVLEFLNADLWFEIEFEININI